MIILILSILFYQCNSLRVYDQTSVDGLIQNNSYAIVFYSVSWCMHCKELKPVMEQLEIEEKAIHPELPIVNVDCSNNDCNYNQFPIVNFYREGILFSSFDGQKKVSTLQRWIVRCMSDLLSKIDEDDIEDLQYENDVLIAIQFSNESVVKTNFNFLERVLKPYFTERTKFVYYIKSYEKDMKINSYVRSVFDPTHYVKKTLSINDVGDYLKFYLIQHMTYPYTKYSPELENKMRLYEAHYLIVYATEFNEGIVSAKALEKYWGKLLGFYVALGSNNVGESIYGKNIQRMFPQTNHIRIITSNERIVYEYFGNWDETSVSEWVDQVMNNQIKPTIRSSKITQQDPLINELTADTFDRFINQDKDICLYVYHRRLSSSFSYFAKNAKALEKIPTIQFGSIDISTEDVMVNMTFRIMPTILMFRGNDHKPIEISSDGDGNGDGSEKEINQFIRKNAFYSINKLSMYNLFETPNHSYHKESYPLEHYKSQLKEL
ncbi:protein disulfide isomerase, putative [Entamoeba dispar SAW760]|uniref:Protein disulfide isomerase, putative n=1 Tax=Entamoeba dispar (strain ATCC PRA-260 / SAW760) TaxID=370354 RepID=B0EE68_ENTDS|nr:protein disulfide isomerase, putative [Entamoeba dispar SAW760]EDR27192.1 protein disulfide isomerase, putative [Entamoeba dispar SAW760]|eukprot:EDR27192.1 protein disulfide isomerase, putative [Entamoeba dispar SAW760]